MFGDRYELVIGAATKCLLDGCHVDIVHTKMYQEVDIVTGGPT